MFKSNLFILFLITLLCSCQTTEKTDFESQLSDQITETRSNLEGDIYEFSVAKLVYYPIYESSALFLGNDQNEAVKIIKLQGFFSDEHTYLNGFVKFGQKFVEIQSTNLPNAYFVFHTYLDEFTETVSVQETEYLNSEGYGLAVRNVLPQHADLSYSDMISALDEDGGDINNLNIPCSGRKKINKYCTVGGCGAFSCKIGGGLGALTVEGHCQCEVSCADGYYACCTQCEGCSCFKKYCCDNDTFIDN